MLNKFNFLLTQTQTTKLMARFHHVLQMIHFICLTLLVLTVATTSPFPIAKKGCDDHCGNISIPFPFGMKSKSCYLNERFLINCNYSSTPNIPILYITNVETTSISLDGQLKLMNYIAQDCYHPNGTRMYNVNPWIWLPSNFLTINSTANIFTIIGCDTYGYAYGQRINSDYVTQAGCMAFCRAEDDLEGGSCTGTGCCQVPIPDDVWNLNLTLSSYHNYTNVSGLGNCSFGFVAEDKDFDFSPGYLTNPSSMQLRMPMLIDWAIVEGANCENARMDSSSYACKGANAVCRNKLGNGYGYRCFCKEGYRGNPYLEGNPDDGYGCQDINECQDTNLNDCEENRCENHPGGYSCTCPKGYHGDGKKEGKGCIRREKTAFKLAAGICTGFIGLLLAACWLHLEFKRRRLIKMRKKFFIQNGGMLLQEQLTRRAGSSSDTARIFSEFELQKATNNFNDNMIIGQGGFGTVYKGLLSDSRIVAIKKSKTVDPNQIEQFINELIVLSKISHRNAVQLLGCCLETQVPLLVYEFISNGTLFEHLHNKAKARLLSWDVRLKLATETAGVLSYLHSYASTPIIHRDVKSANILLDHTFTAKVSDFGASKLVPLDQTQSSTLVRGTLGYLDPEYMLTNQLTEKSDVYSFGVVLVELLTGMKVMSYDRPEEDRSLAHYFLSVMKQKRLFEILEHVVAREGDKEQITKVAELARSCLHDKGDDRPSMMEVAMELEGLRVGVEHSRVQSEHNTEDSKFLLGDGFSSLTNSRASGFSTLFHSARDHTTPPVGDE